MRVNVQPGARKDVIKQVNTDHFSVSVRNKAERNEANKRTLELLSEHLKVPPSSLKIILGHHSPNKIISVEDNLAK